MKERAKQKSVKRIQAKRIETRSVIVLTIAAAVFLIVFFWIHSESIIDGTDDYYSRFGDEVLEYERAAVNEILSEDLRIDEAADGAYIGTQKMAVTIRSGRYKGEDLIAYYYIGPLSGMPVKAGDSVILTIKTHADGRLSATVYEYNRIPVLVIFLLFFCIIVIIIGGRSGAKSLIGLVFTFFCLFTILIPLLLKGAPTIFTTFIICTFIALVSFTILGGVHRKTISAFLGTVSGAFFAMTFSLAVQYLAKIDGLRLGDAEPLLQLKYYVGVTINLRGLLAAGIIISALGAVMDVAMSISSSLEEVHAANPKLSRNQLFRSGMNIGRDMVGTMTNTLILAFLGSEFVLLIYTYARDLPFYYLYSTAFVTLETISGLSSSLGMILAIPLTALISSTLIARNTK